MDVLIPSTDAGVMAQVIGLAVLAAAGLVATRRRPELRVLVVGVTLVGMGLIGVRALH